MSRPARPDDELLLGDWACLGILAVEPSHGFAVSVRLRPDGDIGRVWSLSRPLTYRSIDRLLKVAYIHPVSEEPGIAGGTKTVLSITPAGRLALNAWLRRPVAHLRDLRSELLLKLQLAHTLDVRSTELVVAQRHVVSEIRRNLEQQLRHRTDDIVTSWRLESADAALRFLDSLTDR
jgi:PadR family transcriptional regulator AphA